MFAEGGVLCSIRPAVDGKTEHCFCVGSRYVVLEVKGAGGQFRVETSPGVSHMLQSESPNNKCNVRKQARHDLFWFS